MCDSVSVFESARMRESKERSDRNKRTRVAGLLKEAQSDEGRANSLGEGGALEGGGDDEL